MASIVPVMWLSGGAGAAGGPAAGDAVTIRVELDVPVFEGAGPLVQQVENVIVGDGVELTSADIFDNPEDYCGSLLVDIVPESQTIRISTGQRLLVAKGTLLPTLTSPVYELQDGFDWDNCLYQTAKVTITGGGIGTITTESDNLWRPTGEGIPVDGPAPAFAPALAPAAEHAPMELVEVSATAGDALIRWQSDEWYKFATPGLAVFHYDVAVPVTSSSVPATTPTTTPATSAPATTVPNVIATPAAPVPARPTYAG